MSAPVAFSKCGIRGKSLRSNVIPAQAGIQHFDLLSRWGYVWIPACAGMTINDYNLAKNRMLASMPFSQHASA